MDILTTKLLDGTFQFTSKGLAALTARIREEFFLDDNRNVHLSEYYNGTSGKDGRDWTREELTEATLHIKNGGTMVVRNDRETGGRYNVYFRMPSTGVEVIVVFEADGFAGAPDLRRRDRELEVVTLMKNTDSLDEPKTWHGNVLRSLRSRGVL